jgi:DNA primase
MEPKVPTSDGPACLEQAPLRSGQDWANWLAYARPAQPFGTSSWLRGRQRAAAWSALVDLARGEGFATRVQDGAGGDGFISWYDRRIHVRAGASPAQAVTALAHQLAHVMLHGQIAYLRRAGTFTCAGIRKVEADSVAYLVAVHLGIHAPVAFPRVSHWAGISPRDHPGQTVAAVRDRVLTAATAITAHLDAALPGATAIGPMARRTGGGPVGRAHPGPRRDGAVHCVGRGSASARPPGPRGAGAVASARGGAAPADLTAAGGAAVPREQLVRVCQAAARFFGARLAGSWVPGYLGGRGFGPAIQRRWEAGYAPGGWDTLIRHLRALGYPAAVIEAAGLAHRSARGTLIDTFRDRAMLPIRDGGGTIVAFIGRAPEGARPGVPKYLNSPGTDLYHKREVLFGLWQARDLLARGAVPVIVEGPLDAIAVSAAGPGRYAAVAPCGTAVTSEQIAALAETCDLPTAGPLVAFDPDPAGRMAAIAAYHLLRPLTGTLLAAVLPGGHDPAAILRDRGADELAHVLAAGARPLADLVIDAEIGRWSRWLRYPEGQVNALHGAAPLIAAMPPPDVARQVARLAGRLGLDHATVTTAVTNALRDLPADDLDARRPRPQPRDTARSARRGTRSSDPPGQAPAPTATPPPGPERRHQQPGTRIP